MSKAIKRRGLMLVLSSPSGAGKSTISRALLQRDENLELSVSATTREKRKSEIDGVHYHFLDTARFEEMVEQDEFLEYAKVFDNYYGTPRGPVEEALAQGQDVLFDIDWQGTQQVAAKLPNDLVRVFILPPSNAELERRLYTRAEDSEEVVKARMAKSADEMSHWAEYDYVIINEDLDEAIRQVQQILAAERLKRTRQVGLETFVAGLRSGA